MWLAARPYGRAGVQFRWIPFECMRVRPRSITFCRRRPRTPHPARVIRLPTITRGTQPSGARSPAAKSKIKPQATRLPRVLSKNIETWCDLRLAVGGTGSKSCSWLSVRRRSKINIKYMRQNYEWLNICLFNGPRRWTEFIIKMSQCLMQPVFCFIFYLLCQKSYVRLTIYSLNTI